MVKKSIGESGKTAKHFGFGIALGAITGAVAGLSARHGACAHRGATPVQPNPGTHLRAGVGPGAGALSARPDGATLVFYA